VLGMLEPRLGVAAVDASPASWRSTTGPFKLGRAMCAGLERARQRQVGGFGVAGVGIEWCRRHQLPGFCMC
jgi:hypothetical protein